MPAKSRPKSTPVKGTPAKAARAKPAETAPAEAASAEEAPRPDEVAAEGTTDVPMNRAERRAHSRGKSMTELPVRSGKVTTGHGPAHTQRNWANRRSG